MASTTADSGGDWSFSLAGLADGVHSYTVTAGSGHSTASTSGTLSIGQVTVTGTAQVGKTLTADVTGVPSDATVAYQWNENGKAVAHRPDLPDRRRRRPEAHRDRHRRRGRQLGIRHQRPDRRHCPRKLHQHQGAKHERHREGGLEGRRVPGHLVGDRADVHVLVAGQRQTNQRRHECLLHGPGIPCGQDLSVTVTAHKSGYNNVARTSAAIAVAKGTLTDKAKPKLSGTPEVGKKLARHHRDLEPGSRHQDPVVRERQASGPRDWRQPEAHRSPQR